jgi:hypothetical protein
LATIAKTGRQHILYVVPHQKPLEELQTFSSSVRGVLALGLAEERFDGFGKFLNTTQRVKRELFRVVAVLDELAADLTLYVRPYLFVGVQMALDMKRESC